MKVLQVLANNRKKSFEVSTLKGRLTLPYSQLRLQPTSRNPIETVFVDEEIGKTGFTYQLKSGEEDTILLDQVLEYNKDPDYLRKMLLFKITTEAARVLQSQKISRREVIRRMQTSPTQFYRLLDPTNTSKSLDEMIRLMAALDCDVQLVFPKAA